MNKKFDKNKIKNFRYSNENLRRNYWVRIGIKHFDAIQNYKKSFVKFICEKDKKKHFILKKKFKNTKIVSNENEIFKDKNINLVSIASYDNHHFNQIIKCIRYNKNIIVEKPMCLKLIELKKNK